MIRPTWVAAAAAIGVLAIAPSADAAQTRSVDDDGADCPSAPFSSVQAAVNAADAGDTIAICPGTYTEGNGAPGTNALTINKSLTIKGAGANKVTIQPKRSNRERRPDRHGQPRPSRLRRQHHHDPGRHGKPDHR